MKKLEDVIKHYTTELCGNCCNWKPELRHCNDCNVATAITAMKFMLDYGWTPVSKQSPYIDGKPMKSVLVTMEDCKGGRFVTNTLDRNVTRENKIVAWMPVPDVYKGEA